MSSSDEESGTHHRHKDVYSAEKPIPSIQRFFAKGLGSVIAQRGRDGEEEADSGDDSDSDLSTGPARRQEKEVVKERPDNTSGEAEADQDLPPPEERARERQKQAGSRRRGKVTRVTDPITQAKTKVRDVRRKDFQRAMSNEENRKAGKITAEQAYGTQNVLAGPFPPIEPMPSSLSQIHPSLLPIWLAWAAGLLVLVRSLASCLLVLANALIGWWALQKLRRGVEDKRWERERIRGQNLRQQGPHGDKVDAEDSSAVPGSKKKEGAEWLNGILQSLWEVIDPAIFDSMAGTLEDVMQASAPNFIQAIKVDEVAHGLAPIRFAGVKILPDREADYVMPKKEGEVAGVTRTFSGTHLNLEFAVIYHASSSAKVPMSRHRNARISMSFWLGLKKVATFPLPVWVEIKGFIGTVRARLQLTPEAPFIKNVTITFMGLPRVQVEVVPMRINLANIPVLSSFVQNSIDAALSEYCAPSSLTMDVGELLMGDSIKREVHALGVLVIWIHAASDLEKQDRTGSSDPYITISYSRLGKISYATRVALNDLNPRWEERHVMLLTPDAIRAQEKLSLALFDSDRYTADDLLGRIEVNLAPLIRQPGQVFDRNDTLMGLSNEHKKQGQLSWSIAFFPKLSREVEDSKKSTSESDETHPVQDANGDKNEHINKDRDANPCQASDPFAAVSKDTSPEELLELLDAAESATQTRNQSHSTLFNTPRDSHPSGIVSVQVHNIIDLSYADAGKNNKNRPSSSSSASGGQAGASGQLIDEVEDENERPDAPSAFVSIVLNDQTAMISRVKALSNAPFFNIGCERFIRDWRKCIIMIVVRDRRLRESDPILGVVPINLRDLFLMRRTSQITQYFPMGGGIGHGSVRISVLFKAVEGMHYGKENLGLDIGTMRVRSYPKAVDLSESTVRHASIRMRTLIGNVKVSSRHAYSASEEGSIQWRWPSSRSYLRIPVRRRYIAPFVFEFRKMNALGVKTIVACSLIWMQDLPDDEEIDLCLPIYKGSPDLHRFVQNYHDYRTPAEEIEEALSVKKIGSLRVKLQFKSGIGRKHREVKGHPDSVAVYEAWNACVAAGLRPAGGDFAVATGNADEESSDGSGHQEEEDGSGGGGESEGEVGHEGIDPTRVGDKVNGAEDRKHPDELDRVSDEDEDEDEGGGGDASIVEKLKAWREESKEKHRLHRGIKSHKAARTASWLVTSAKEGGHKVKMGLNLQERGTQQIDSEL